MGGMGEQNIIDFSKCPNNGIQYSGSEKKQGIIFSNSYFMLKFRKTIPPRQMYNHVSEYLASHIFALAGIDVHETVLGHYYDEEVVAVKDFTAGSDWSLVEFESNEPINFQRFR